MIARRFWYQYIIVYIVYLRSLIITRYATRGYQSATDRMLHWASSTCPSEPKVASVNATVGPTVWRLCLKWTQFYLGFSVVAMLAIGYKGMPAVVIIMAAQYDRGAILCAISRAKAKTTGQWCVVFKSPKHGSVSWVLVLTGPLPTTVVTPTCQETGSYHHLDFSTIVLNQAWPYYNWRRKLGHIFDL